MKTDYRQAPLDGATRALLDACVRLTVVPWKSTAAEIERLRGHGFTDEAIHDAFQIAAYFNDINRVCDGLGVDHEDFMPDPPADWALPDPRVWLQSE